MKNRRLVGAVLCVGTIIGMGGAVSAGEITGNGKPTPIKDRQVCDFESGNCPNPAGPANSFCAFSGLNDEPDAPDPEEAGKVQSWGAGVKKASVEERVYYATNRLIQQFGPGTECRGGFPTLGDLG